MKNKNQASHCLDFHFEYIFPCERLDTSNQLQSILTLIVQTIVNAVQGTYSKQPSKGP